VDYIVVTGDTIMWMPSFGSATVLAPATAVVSGSAAKVKVTQKAMALEGDEMKWMSTPVPYMSGSFSVPGMAVCKVQKLGADQTTSTTTFEGKAGIIKGSNFMAVLMVMVPAMMPTPAGPVPDPVPMYPGGMGKFITTNTVVKAG